MFIDTVGSFDAKSDVVQASSDDEDVQVRVQLHGVNGDLLAEVNVDSKANIGQKIARCRSLDSTTEDTLRDWQERGILSLMGSDRDMAWPVKDNYTKIMLTGPVKQRIHFRCSKHYMVCASEIRDFLRLRRRIIERVLVCDRWMDGSIDRLINGCMDG